MQHTPITAPELAPACPECGATGEQPATETHKPAFVAALARGLCALCADDYTECEECGCPTPNRDRCDSCNDAAYTVQECRAGYAELRAS